ncbi:MAG: hypothetical protein NTZ05_15910 [Chloroflexi bacterium]|nr:hypothetical protein [Chloroflexota bacterium]
MKVQCVDCRREFDDPAANISALFRRAPSWDLRRCGDCQDAEAERQEAQSAEREAAHNHGRLRAYWATSGVGPWFLGARLDTFAVEEAHESVLLAVETVSEWVGRVDLRRPGNSPGLILRGQQTGPGKTHLAVAALYAVLTRQFAGLLDAATIQQRWRQRWALGGDLAAQRRFDAQQPQVGRNPVHWISAPRLLLRLEEARQSRGKSGDSERAIYDELAAVPLLAIDELGAAPNAMIAKGQAHVWETLIEMRYDLGWPLLATSGLSEEWWRAAMGERTISRLTEMCAFVALEGGDYRARSTRLLDGAAK